MNSRSFRWMALALATALFLPTFVFAQSGSARSGVVSDASGGPIPGVTVTATNTATGVVRTAVTGSDGSYRFPSLPPGTYTVTAELSGFRSEEHTSELQSRFG